MKCLDFDWQINEFMVYCRRTPPRIKNQKILRKSAATTSYHTYKEV